MSPIQNYLYLYILSLYLLYFSLFIRNISKTLDYSNKPRNVDANSDSTIFFAPRVLECASNSVIT